MVNWALLANMAIMSKKITHEKPYSPIKAKMLVWKTFIRNISSMIIPANIKGPSPMRLVITANIADFTALRRVIQKLMRR